MVCCTYGYRQKVKRLGVVAMSHVKSQHEKKRVSRGCIHQSQIFLRFFFMDLSMSKEGLNTIYKLFSVYFSLSFN